MEMALNLKNEDLIKLIESTEKGIDFWGDKKLITPLNANIEEINLPIHIVENIINDEKNYMNLRLNFDKFKIEFEEILENIKSYIKKDEDPKKPILYMQSYTEIITNFWLFVFYRARESSIKTNDYSSSFYLTKLIKTIKNNDYFKASICNFPCHINETYLNNLENNKFNFYNPGMLYDSNFTANIHEVNNNSSNNGRNFGKGLPSEPNLTTNNNNDHNNYIKNINLNNKSNITKTYDKSEMESKNNDVNVINLCSSNITSVYIDNSKNNNNLYNNKCFDIKNIFLKSLSFYNKGDGEEELHYIKNNFFIPVFNNSYLDAENLSLFQSIKYDFLFLSERRFGEIRNLTFKMNSIVEKFMIFLEINRNNTDSIELNKRKINFFDIYIKICEFKYKYYIICNDKILNFNESVLENLEKELKNAYTDIIPNDNLEDLNEKLISDIIAKISGKNPNNNQNKDGRESQGSGNSFDLSKNNNSIPKISVSKKRFHNNSIKTNELNSSPSGKKNELHKSSKNFNKGNFTDEDDEELIKQKSFLNGKSNERKRARGSVINQNGYNPSVRQSSLIFLKLMESQKENVILEDVLINNKLVECNIKLEQHIIIEYLLKGSKLLFDFYKHHLKVFLLKKGISIVNRENSAIIDLFNKSRSDLDIIKFQNKFSSSLLKNLDDLHYSSINQKFSFFETFFNKIQNISLEVETHTVSNAVILTKYEFENSIKNLIRDFIIYDVNSRNFINYTNNAENFGLYAKLMKQENIINILKEKLKDYDNNFEKICNAKLALQGNRTIYEMDNLYRQLKILRDNVSVMEEYIKSFFEERFKQIVTGLKNQTSIIESKFSDFKTNIISSTVQNITEEYNKCLGDLKAKHENLAEAAKNLQENAGHKDKLDKSGLDKSGEGENSFFEHFKREMEIETNYNREVNRERMKNDNLYEDISKLHAYYRMKLLLQKSEFEKNLAELNQKLSSNQDLWDKLGIAEKNEKILKEELSKTQKSLAYAEEFNKKLQTQIRKSHDTNTNLEKQISMISANHIINNARKGENIKALELQEETKAVYVYNMKNNTNLVGALERIKKICSDNAEENSIIPIGNNENLYLCDLKIILENLESLHLKYTQEVDNKRNFVNMLNKLKEDVTNMRDINKMNVEAANNKLKSLTEQLNQSKLEIEIMKKNCLNPNHLNNSHLNFHANLVSNLGNSGNLNMNNNINKIHSKDQNNGDFNSFPNSQSKSKVSNSDNHSSNQNFISNSNFINLKGQIPKNNLAPLKNLNNSSNNWQFNNLNNNSNHIPILNQDLMNFNSNSLSNSIISKTNYGIINNPINTSLSIINNYANTYQQNVKDLNNNSNSKNKLSSINNKKVNINFNKTSANFNLIHGKQNQISNHVENNILDIINVNMNVNPIFSSNLLHTMNNHLNSTSSAFHLTSDAKENKTKSTRGNISNLNNNLNHNIGVINHTQLSTHRNQFNSNSNAQVDSEVIKITKTAKLGIFNTESSLNDSVGNMSLKKEMLNIYDENYEKEKKDNNQIENNQFNDKITAEMNDEKINSAFFKVGLSIISDNNIKNI